MRIGRSRPYTNVGITTVGDAGVWDLRQKKKKKITNNNYIQYYIIIQNII